MTLPEKIADNWISVNERLPEASKPYEGKLGWGLNKVLINCGTGICTGYFWGESDDPMNGWSDLGVTHWMPLPEPPQI